MLLYFSCALVAQCLFSVQCESRNTTKKHYEEDDPGELVILQIVSRNGQHTPIKLYASDPNRPSAFPEGLGQLTQLGMLQQYQMGRLLRKRYDHFITSDPREVDVLSAFEDRSMNSVLSQLASLYAPTSEWQFMPDYSWQPIQVQYIHSDHDKYLGLNPVCPKLAKEWKSILNSDDGQAFNDENQELYEYWSNSSGNSINHWNHVRDLYKTLKIEKALGLEVPPWAKHYWNQLKRISDLSFLFNYSTELSLKLYAGNLMYLLTERMHFRADKEPLSKLNVCIYSTHSSNIAALLLIMSRYNGIEPPPGATLVFEMYKKYEAHTIRVLYFNSSKPETGHQEPHVLTMRGCQEYCPVAFFINMFRDFLPKDWSTLCGVKYPGSTERVEPGTSAPPQDGILQAEKSASMLP